MRQSSAKRWANYYNPHPCATCAKIIKKARLKYCSWSCNVAGMKGRNTWAYGRKLTLEHRTKVSLSLVGNKRRLGKPHADWERAKMSAASLGKPKSEAHRRAMSETSLKMAQLGLKSTMLGRKMSIQSKTKLSDALRKSWRSGRKMSSGSPAYDYMDRFGRLFKMRSRWEVSIAEQLDGELLTWQYEPHVISLPDGRNYIPDFWVTEFGGYLEIKGWTGAGRLEKFELAKQIGIAVDLITNPKDWRICSALYAAHIKRQQISA